MKANRAPMVMATSRNGNKSNQTKGKRTMARIASGQHSTNKMHHRTTKISSFIVSFVSVFSVCSRLNHAPGRVHYKRAVWLERAHLFTIFVAPPFSRIFMRKRQRTETEKGGAPKADRRRRGDKGKATKDARQRRTTKVIVVSCSRLK